LALQVKLLKQPKEFLEQTDRKTREAILKHFAQLAADPFAFPLSKPLKARPERCCRVGNYRILFLVEEDKSILLIVIIGDRRDVYKL
jgi:mRNA-degrading endonuclease RelE of RelBE toxin-antitoxin system